MLTRREFIRTAAAFALAPEVFAEREQDIWVNDVHSQLNRTRVRELLTPRTREELVEIVRSASRKGLPISVSGDRKSTRLNSSHPSISYAVFCLKKKKKKKDNM